VSKIAQISAAIATLDRPEGLARCLDALLSGSVLPTEVIIVDQSDNDATEKIVLTRQSSRVPIVYVRQSRRGLSASRNAALARVSCPLVAVTDDDCVPDPGWIAAIVRALSSETPPDALTGRVLPFGPESPDNYVVSARESLLRQDFAGKTLPWIVGSGGNFAVQRRWFESVGGWDERLGAGSPGQAAEDMDLFYRLLRAGARIRYEPDALIYHERASKARRLKTRWSYGYGMGAFCCLWLCRGDPYALRMLSRWLRWQCWDFIIAAVRRQWLEAYQRWLSLRGTACGLIYGLKLDSVEYVPKLNTTTNHSAGNLRSLQ
jgi:GT2 family glycosyltransferase